MRIMFLNKAPKNSAKYDVTSVRSCSTAML